MRVTITRGDFQNVMHDVQKGIWPYHFVQLPHSNRDNAIELALEVDGKPHLGLQLALWPNGTYSATIEVAKPAE